MKCQKCGDEFQGNFCPNCGEPALGENDNYNFEEEYSVNKKRENIIWTKNSFLYAAMVFIFLIITLFGFLFFFGGICQMSLDKKSEWSFILYSGFFTTLIGLVGIYTFFRKMKSSFSFKIWTSKCPGCGSSSLSCIPIYEKFFSINPTLLVTCNKCKNRWKM